jgi:hypothetical protein
VHQHNRGSTLKVVAHNSKLNSKRQVCGDIKPILPTTSGSGARLAHQVMHWLKLSLKLMHRV